MRWTVTELRKLSDKEFAYLMQCADAFSVANKHHVALIELGRKRLAKPASNSDRIVRKTLCKLKPAALSHSVMVPILNKIRIENETKEIHGMNLRQKRIKQINGILPSCRAALRAHIKKCVKRGLVDKENMEHLVDSAIRKLMGGLRKRKKTEMRNLIMAQQIQIVGRAA